MNLPARPVAVYGLSFHPDALNDLLAAPGDMRDLALARLQDAVRAQIAGGKLRYDLAGYRKLYLGARADWRIVYAHRPAPPGAPRPTEIHVVAMGPRERHEVYHTVRARMGLTRPATGPRAHAARSRPPHLRTHTPAPSDRAPAAPPVPGLPAPALTVFPKGPAR
ncbi:hypothetical protein ACFWXK_20525 [Streptomyces sp. NPDC059070]|uniref:hypothetical protein n=1 Tax=Streptomyces sp. NPDC059070 TaxID=3346713 RepID=UPI0036C54C69